MAPGTCTTFTKAGTALWHGALLSTAGPGKYQAPSITTGDGYVLISAGDTGGKRVAFTLAPGATTWAQQTAAAGVGPAQVTTVFDSLAGAYLGLLTAASGGTLTSGMNTWPPRAGTRKPSPPPAPPAPTPAARSPRPAPAS